MPEHLLRSKFYIPQTRPSLVSRPQLIDRLNQGLQLGHRLSLIASPAGFGKTTLASAWVASCGRPAAWLSLDEGDSDPVRFLAYFITALQTIWPTMGEGVLGALKTAQPPPMESILTVLLNEITAVPDNFAFVLDDYYLIDATPVDASTSVDASANVDRALTFLLEHLPPQMHLVIATREDPNLPLARLRARGQLTELRETDMRFTLEEASGFLNHVMGLSLSLEEISALEVHTEGWIAGLQMAALSMQRRADTSRFIQDFTGSHHYVFDYLVEEVLDRQPPHVRRFLLQTSILERLNAALCDAVRFGETPSSSEGTTVTDQEDSKGLLASLERDNLFVVPLDDRRHWYRYHHLFADVLQAHLMEEQPNLIPDLHLRASAWYEHNDLPADAIRHALAAKDFKRVAELVELAWPAMDASFQSTAWLGWMKELPDELVRARPVLSVAYAWALLNTGELEAGMAHLRDAEEWLGIHEEKDKRPGDLPVEMVVVDDDQFRSLPASIASARTYYAQALGDIPGCMKYARRALDLLPDDDYFGRGRVAVLLGLAQWTSGDLEGAQQTFAGAMSSFQQAGNIVYAISFTFIIADILATQGHLHEAVNSYERSVRLVAEQDEPVSEGMAELLLGLSELHREQGDLQTARQYMLRSEALNDQSEVYRYRLCRAQARIKEAEGDLDGTLEHLDEAERWLFYRTPLPDVRPTAALKSRVWIRQGRLREAEGWARERDLSADDDLDYLREFEHLTLARLLIARYESDQIERSMQEAMELLDRLLEAAEAGGRMGSVIEILIVQALAHQARSDIASALLSLERALLLAEPEGYVRIFVDEGPPMAALLREAAKQGVASRTVNLLQAAFGKAEGTRQAAQFLADPLSERELEVLRLLGTELSGPEIARELMVSPNTMRTHTRNIYSKLGVHSRRTAVRRAAELDLN